MGRKTLTRSEKQAIFYRTLGPMSRAKTTDAIREVTKAVTEHEFVGQLLRCKLQKTFNKEMKSLSQQQGREALRITENATLKYDGTTKKLGYPVQLHTELETLETRHYSWGYGNR